MGDLVQQLGEVLDVGEVPLAAAPGEHPLGHPGDVRRLEDRRDAARPRVVGPAPQRLGHVVGQVRVGRELGGGAAEEHGGGRGADQAGPARLLERLEQALPVGRRLRGEDVGVAGVDGRHAGRRQRVTAGAGVAVALDDHGDVAGPDRPDLGAVVVGRVGGEQRLHVGREVGRDERAQVVHRDGAGAADPERVAGDHPQPERVVGRAPRPADESRVAPRPARTTMSSWPRAAPSRTRSSRCTRGRVAAVVGVEGEQRVGPVAGPQVGDDVAAAEGVDRLLGVADQHQRHPADERALDHLPLHRVGVLELVDHDDRPAPAHPVAGRRVVGLERDREPGQQVVEAEDAEQPLAPLELADARRRRTRGVRRPSSRPAGRAG